MNTSSQPVPSSPAADDLNNAIAVLVARLDEYLRLIERIDSKARQAFAVCAGFYAGAQAVAFTSFAEVDVSTGERTMLLATAVLATASLVRVAQLLIRNERLREEGSFAADGVVGWLGGGEGHASSQLVLNLARVCELRAEGYRDRVAGYGGILGSARWVLALAALEALVAMIVRV